MLTFRNIINMISQKFRSLANFSKQENQELTVVVYDHRLEILEGSGCLLQEYPYDAEIFLRQVPDALQRICPTGHPLYITLVLPPIFFQYTPFTLPGIEENRLFQALRLQASHLLSTSSGDELLADMNFGYDGEHGHALWMKKKFVDQLFDALKQRNIFLEKIIPRPLALNIQDTKNYCLEDVDQYQSTCVSVSDGSIIQWVTICGKDREIPEFFKEYNEAKDNLIHSKESPSSPCLTIQSGCLRWRSVDRENVYFVPPGYNILERQRVRKRIRNGLFAAGCIFVLVLSLPLLRLSLQERNMREEIAALKVRNAELIRLSSEIADFNEQWGIITEFPNIDVAELLVNLNKLIPIDSWLSSLSLDNGILEITGYSPEPDKILSVLSKQDYFVDVSYSQVVRVEHEKGEYNYFGIQCKLKNMDILSYLEKYFQNEYEY